MLQNRPPEPIHLEHQHDYVLSEADRHLIKAFEFKLSNNLQSLGDAIGWVVDFPYAKKLITNVINYDRYFRARQQAILEAIPKLQASINPDIQAMAEPLTRVANELGKLTDALAVYPTEPSADAARGLLAQCRSSRAALKPLSETIRTNPAYTAYNRYIYDNQLEASRVTVDFDLEYGEEAA